MIAHQITNSIIQFVNLSTPYAKEILNYYGPQKAAEVVADSCVESALTVFA